MKTDTEDPYVRQKPLPKNPKCEICFDTGWNHSAAGTCAACDAFDPDDEEGIGQLEGTKRYGMIMLWPGRWVHRSGALVVQDDADASLWHVAEDMGAGRLHFHPSHPAGTLQQQAEYLDSLLPQRKRNRPSS